MSARAARLLLLALACVPLASSRAQSPAAAATVLPEAGVSHPLALARAARLSDLAYTLSYTLTAATSSVQASETATFGDTGTGDLAIDFRDGTLLSASLNGHVLPVGLVNGHLVLPAALLQHGPNRLLTTFTVNTAPAGKAITRYTDKDDGSEYLYTLFVPADADMAFPCFDQPDLKARFTLTITAPGNWQVVANASGEHVMRQELSLSGPVTVAFPQTSPISTYLFAFAAGPFARIPGKPGEPDLYVRKSQLAKAQKEAPEVQGITKQGIAWLSAYFAQPFPFSKYDLVLIPGFPFGGMEHAGATFLNEDGVLFRSTPTASDYFRRDILVLHETTHQWFGDLVTMRWFDDLWLKEGFAQYMAYKAMAALKPETDPWKHFNEDIKPLAYAIDETQGTTPIFQSIPNLIDAKSAYGAIVYQKAPAVLKQLDYRLGDDVFRHGLRLYLKQHAYANATWPDLIHAFTEAGGKDVQPWADAWITRRGMPQVDTAFTCAAGRLTSLTLTQHDILPDGYLWPITNEVLLSNAGRLTDTRVEWATASTRVPYPAGQPCPDAVFANHHDQAYGRFLLDPVSASAVAKALTPASVPAAPAGAIVADPFLRSQLWTAMWENVRTARQPPSFYATLALQTLPIESDEALSRIQGARIGECLRRYLGPTTRKVLLVKAERTVADRMEQAPTLGLRIVNFRTFVSIAESYQALSLIKQMLSGRLTIPDLTFQRLDRWNMIGRLIAQAEPEAQVALDAERAGDPSGEAQKYAYAALAGSPDAASKARYFADYQGTKIQEDWLTQSLRAFNSTNQQALTLPYLRPSLDLLPDIKRNRKIFFLGAWLSAFLDGQTTPEAQAIVDAWLKQPGIDPDLRRKVLENKDALDRTVLIRRAFPD